METQDNITGPSLVSVLWQKLVAQVERHSLKQIAKCVGLAFAAGLLSAAFIDGPSFYGTLDQVLAWHNAAVAKICVVYAAFFLYRPLKYRVISFIASFVEGESEEG